MTSYGIDSRYARREKRILLDIARRALTLAVTTGAALQEFPADEVLSQPGGAFVTLRRRGRLRGCVGQFATDLALIQVVAHCAIAASRHDPRFPSVTSEELAEIEIELSILSSEAEIRPEQIEIGRHGLIVTNGKRRGVLLPQVAAERGWTSERFLQETCAKAGMDRSAWKNSTTRIEAFTAEVFGESDLDTASEAV
jgi:AmmeMemoRadiSam system protein A